MQVNSLWVFLLGLAVTFPSLAHAQDDGVKQSRPTSPISANPATPLEVTFKVQYFEVVGDNPFTTEKVQSILQPYTGDQVSLARLQEAATALENALQKAGYGFYRVTVPPQAMTKTVHLQLLRFSMGRIKVEGAQQFSEANIRRSVPELQEGQTPNVHQVARSMALANENPAKRISLTLKESDLANAFDAMIKVTEQRPLSASTVLSNTGSVATGRDRLMTSVQHANLFDRDHVVSASYVTAPSHADDVQQYGMFYRVPFYQWGGALTASGSYSSVTSGALGTGQTITGAGRTLGLNYTHYFQPEGRIRHYLSLGIDDKLFRGVTFNGVPLAPDVRSRPLTLSWSQRREVDHVLGSGLMSLSADFVTNLPGGASNNETDYAANQLGASQRWQSYRLGWAAYLRTPTDTIWNLRLNLQYATKPLIAGERFGVGGATSVRGMEERVMLGESGLFVSTEWQSKPGLMPDWMPQLNQLRGLVFVDAGQVQRRESLTLPASEHVVSMGVGLRWPISTYGSFSLDAARIMAGTQSPLAPTGNVKVHANLALRF